MRSRVQSIERPLPSTNPPVPSTRGATPPRVVPRSRPARRRRRGSPGDSPAPGCYIRRIGRVLIIDDHADSGEALVRLFRRWGYEPKLLTDARDACAMVLAFAPDVILLDLMMPHVNGEDVLRAVRADARCAAVPVVIFSGDFQGDREKRLRDAGANDYVVKGTVSFDALRRRVEAILPAAPVRPTPPPPPRS